MIPICHPDKPHAAKRLCRACYNAQYNRHKRLDALSTILAVSMRLAVAERQRKHDPRKYIYVEEDQPGD